jgi:hypothetical protein
LLPCATTQPRKSWNLSPEDLTDADCEPSQWRLFEAVHRALCQAIISIVRVQDLINTGQALHRRLAHTRRKRKLQINYRRKRLI